MLTQNQFDFFCRAIADFGVKHVIIRQHDREIFRHHFEPEAPCGQFSITKSFTGTAVGFAVEEGLFALEDRVIDLFPDEAPKNPSPQWQALTVKHLLTMQMGFDRQYLMGYQRKTMKETDWVDFVFRQPMPDYPGRYFKYSNAGPYLAGILVERTSGEELIDYLMPRLLEPLGIARPEWGRDPLGHVFGASDMVMTTEEVSRFGQLYLDRGRWKGEQILPPAWVKKVWDTTISTEEGQNDYSLLFWRGRYDSICSVGRNGQYCSLVPEKDLVVTINSFDTTNENLMEYVWTYLYPHL
ncbi:MAG: serine hydrolase [Lachnospiraceae bacterium]|nr:serine hydrolase [Lachnospiraceae bacterium]